MAGGPSRVVVAAGGERAPRAPSSSTDVDRWWPAGHGDQPLYDVRVALSVDDEVHRRGRRDASGSATLRWDTEPDAAGTPFQLVVNDRPIFVKGANWIPDDAFPARVDRARYRAPARAGARRELNLMRVWGGGIYESDDFYDLCDELGLLTWQDFLFACAAYPEEEPLRVGGRGRGPRERRPPRPPRLAVLLTGNNENLWGYEDWGWKERLDGRTWGALLLLRAAPGHRRRARTARALRARQPVQPRRASTRTTSRTAPTHLWEHWNPLDWPAYRDVAPRFVAEFGWQGPPAWSTLTRAISDDPLTPESPGHDRAPEGRPTGTSSSPTGLAAPLPRPGRHGDLALGDAAQPGQRGLVRARVLPLRSRRTPRAPSSGSSTTAGRSPPGRRSTATDARSRSTSPCGTRSRRAWSPSSRGATGSTRSSVNDTDALAGRARADPPGLRWATALASVGVDRRPRT